MPTPRATKLARCLLAAVFALALLPALPPSLASAQSAAASPPLFSRGLVLNTASGSNGSSPILGDFNADGALDILQSEALLAGGSEVRVYAGQGGGSFAVRSLTQLGDVYPFVAADLDGDSDLDIVARTPAGTPDLIMLANDGAGGFTRRQIVAGSGLFDMRGVAVGDLNGDGRADIAGVGQDNNGDAALHIAVQGSDRTFALTTLALQLPISANPTHLALADLDGGALSWQVYDVDAPAWVNDLAAVSYGQGYWVRVSQGAAPAAAATAQLASGGILAPPPATYYGAVPAVAGVTPAAGQRVEALVDGVVCGEATAEVQGGAVVFAVDVVAASSVDSAGCGLAGRTVAFTVEGEAFPRTYAWDNSRPVNIDAPAAGFRVYLPLVEQ